jgi:hypothetical protein
MCVLVYSCRPGDTVGIGLDCPRGVVFWTLNGLYGGVVMDSQGLRESDLLGLPQVSGTVVYLGAHHAWIAAFCMYLFSVGIAEDIIRVRRRRSVGPILTACTFLRFTEPQSDGDKEEKTGAGPLPMSLAEALAPIFTTRG